MENEGVLKPIEVSDWATLLSVFLKLMVQKVFVMIIKAQSTQQFRRSSSLSLHWRKNMGEYPHGRNLQKLICKMHINNCCWTRSHKNCVRLTPIKVFSNTHVCHLDFHRDQLFGSASLNKYLQGLTEHV